MPRISFVVHEQPVPAGRPRFSSRGKFVRVFTPKANKDFMAIVQHWARLAMARHGKPIIPGDVPVVVNVHFNMKRPKSRKNDVWHLTKPDYDNLGKLTVDGMSGIVFEDDKQVVCGRKSKCYAPMGASGSANVEIIYGEQDIYEHLGPFGPFGPV